MGMGDWKLVKASGSGAEFDKSCGFLPQLALAVAPFRRTMTKTFTS
jgi:hypothetical protein